MLKESPTLIIAVIETRTKANNCTSTWEKINMNSNLENILNLKYVYVQPLYVTVGVGLQ